MWQRLPRPTIGERRRRRAATLTLAGAGVLLVAAAAASVILGHVDSKSGPGVFYHLKALRRGDRIRIRLVTGKTIQFVVTGSKEVPKTRFPTKLVFAHTTAPTLRLVTCGGGFNYATGH